MKGGQNYAYSNKDDSKKTIRYTKELAEFLTKAMDKPHCAAIEDPNVVTVYDAIYYYISKIDSDYIKYPIPNFKEAYKK